MIVFCIILFKMKMGRQLLRNHDHLEFERLKLLATTKYYKNMVVSLKFNDSFIRTPVMYQSMKATKCIVHQNCRIALVSVQQQNSVDVVAQR